MSGSRVDHRARPSGRGASAAGFQRVVVPLHLDTFHMNIEEANPLDAIEQALPHLAYFELDQNHRGLPDRGAIDFTPILATLFRANYSGLIGVEAFSSCVTGPDVAAIIGIWRDMFADGSDVARAGATIVRNAYRDFHSTRSGHPALPTH
jgi:D-psicose/D-tagatose/L-ribulose 3-epimerase